MKPPPRTFSPRLRSLSPLDTIALARVAGGESLTSTSGTPAAGDAPTDERVQRLLSYVHATGNG